MSEPTTLVLVGSFLLAFKATLVEGSEVAILSLATVKQLGRGNVLAGVLLGVFGSVFTFILVRQFFVLLPELLIEFGTGAVILYFSYRFLRGFVRYYFGKRSFRTKMEKMRNEVIEKEMERLARSMEVGPIPFSLANSLPVLSITLTEGFEASLVLSAAGAFNLDWTVAGALVSIATLVVICAASYDYLIRFPRWLLDMIAGTVLLVFGLFFIVSGLFAVL